MQEKSPFNHPLHEYEDFAYDKLPKMVKRDPEGIRYALFEQTFEKVADSR